MWPFKTVGPAVREFSTQPPGLLVLAQIKREREGLQAEIALDSSLPIPLKTNERPISLQFEMLTYLGRLCSRFTKGFELGHSAITFEVPAPLPAAIFNSNK